MWTTLLTTLKKVYDKTIFNKNRTLQLDLIDFTCTNLCEDYLIHLKA